MLRIPLVVLSGFFAGLVNAQAWQTGIADNDEYHYAVTANDSDGLLGQFCYPEAGSCIWLVLIKTRCDDDAQSPVLGSASSGAFHVQMVCRGSVPIGGVVYYRYVLDDFGAVDGAVRASGSIGFALPLESGQFRVFRFDVSRAAPAIDRMRAKAEAATKKTPKNTRDRVL